jgi:hypothetical protein
MSGMPPVETPFRIVEEVLNCVAFIVVAGLIIKVLTSAN